MKFKEIKAITLPIRKLNNNTPAYLKFTSAMREAPHTEAQKEKGEGPVTVLNCIDLESGQECQIVVPMVLHSILDENFENDSYVGRCFKVEKGDKPSGKRYHPFFVTEVEVEEESPAEKPAKK